MSISDSAKTSSLTTLAAGKWRVSLEESWYHERPEVRNPDRHWYEIIPCRGGGFIGLYAEAPEVLLQLYTPKAKNARLIWEAIKENNGVWADFHLDGEAVIYFPAELLHKVAALSLARKKRRLSPEDRARLVESGKAFRFSSQDYGVKVEKTGQI